MTQSKILNKAIRNAQYEKTQEMAFEYVDENGKTKEQILEEHEEYIAEIEGASPDDNNENFIWNTGYVQWYEQGLIEAKRIIQENIK